MERKEFLKMCSSLIKSNGFEKKGTTHIYKCISENIMLVVALTHSNTSAKYWFEGGFVLKQINKHLPYPKYYDVNIRTMNIGINKTYYIDYLNITEEECDILKKSIQDAINFYLSCETIDEIINKIILPGLYSLCKDEDMQLLFDGLIPDIKLIPDESQI